MNAMEKMFISMLSQMTGLTADEMQMAVKASLTLLQTIEQRFAAIENKLDILLDDKVITIDSLKIEDKSNDR